VAFIFLYPCSTVFICGLPLWPSFVAYHAAVPYRIEFLARGGAAFDRLVELGALDVEIEGGRVAAFMPDSVTPEEIAGALGLDRVAASAAAGRDEGSVWVLRPRAFQVGRLRIAPAGTDADPAALELIDAAAFGTGLHPTTALSIEALDDILQREPEITVLDVGTGSGVLALAALKLGAREVLAIDIDEEALRVAAENARINALDDRLRLAHGGPDTVTGTWPVVVANILAAPLIEMAPALIRRVGHHGILVLSGIPESVAADVARAYRRIGMRHVETKARGGWVALVLQASW